MIDFGFDLAGIREPRLWRGVLLSSAGAVLDAAPVLLAFFVLDRVLHGRADEIPLLGVTLVLVGLLAGAYVLRAMGSLDNFVGTYRLVGATRLRLADHVRRVPMGFFRGRRTGEVASVLTDDFAQYSEIATHAWSLVVANVALPTALGIVLLVADWRLGLLALAPVPLAVMAIPWSYRLLCAASDRVAATKRSYVGDVVELVGGLETLSALRASGRFRDAIDQRTATLTRDQLAAEVAPAPAMLTFSLLVHTGTSLVLLGGAGWVASGTVDPIRFVLVTLLAVHFARTLSSLVIYLAEARHASRTLQRVRALFAEPVQPEGDRAPTGPPELAVEGVTFSYGDEPALRDVTLGFPQGTVTALVGPSGSGKSTLAHLLCRLWDVDAGQIELGGVDVRDLPLPTLHRSVATVFQDVVLFEDTVAENVRLGRPDATRAEVEAAIRAAGAHDFVAALPDGSDTLLGPDGAGLSGGERQRLSIARALLKDAPILVLDEATASVDPDREHEIQQAIARLMDGRTVILVAHRLWTVQDVDQIVVLDDGAVAERGTHATLLARDGLYASLWRAQQDAADWSFAAADA